MTESYATAMERGLGGRVRHAVRGLTPGYFALVMATGIVSVGLNLVDHRTLSVLLLWVAGAAFVVLLILNICRLIGFREAFSTTSRTQDEPSDSSR